LTILSGSQGFNANGVYDYLASTKDADGNLVQALGLSFYGQGLASLASGGVFKFSLNVADQSSPPRLASQAPGVSIALETPDNSTGSNSTSTGTGGNTEVTTANIPEPWSVCVWLAILQAGLLQSYSRRRSIR